MGNAWSSRRKSMSRPQVCQVPECPPEDEGPPWEVISYLAGIFAIGGTIYFEEVDYNYESMMSNLTQPLNWYSEETDGDRLLTASIENDADGNLVNAEFNIKIAGEVVFAVNGAKEAWDDWGAKILPDVPLEEDIGDGAGSIDVPPL